MFKNFSNPSITIQMSKGTKRIQLFLGLVITTITKGNNIHLESKQNCARKIENDMELLKARKIKHEYNVQ